MHELKLRLPAALGDVIKPDKYQIENVNLIRTNSPGWATVLFHRPTFVFLRESVETTIHGDSR
jgi:hypothetical protein